MCSKRRISPLENSARRMQQQVEWQQSGQDSSLCGEHPCCDGCYLQVSRVHWKKALLWSLFKGQWCPPQSSQGCCHLYSTHRENCYLQENASKQDREGCCERPKIVSESNQRRTLAKDAEPGTGGGNSPCSTAQNPSAWSRHVSIEAREKKLQQKENSKCPGGSSGWTDLVLCVCQGSTLA